MIRNDDPRGVTRRELLGRASASAGLAILSCGAQRPGPSKAAPADEAEQIARLQARAKKTGLGTLRMSRTEHFLCLGDAPDGYREEALTICEALGASFVSHLSDRGFKTEMPTGRMLVVALKDSKSYEAYLGDAPGEAVGGHYSLDSNRLVIFDFRPREGEPEVPGAERINTFTLVHETAHLLSFNTGLLTTDHEPPKCISEGLATYFEMWRPRARAGVGAVNLPRLMGIRNSFDAGVPWIETGRLFSEDALFDEEATYHLAYGQAWVLLHYLIQSQSWRPRLAAYLQALQKTAPQAGADRIKTAEEHLGPMDKMDERMQKATRSLLRKLRD
jgi:hypothetical protein